MRLYHKDHKKMRIFISGSTGMIGKSLLLTSLQRDDISEVVTLVRSPSGVEHEKLKEIVHADYTNISDHRDLLTQIDAAFYCMGISAAGLNEEQYKHITYNLTLSIAQELHSLNPNIRICYVSGTGTDSSENGRVMWARIKGMTENALIKMHDPNGFMFRPGYIQPMKGVKSRTWWYNALYAIFAPLYPLLKLLMGKQLLTSEELSLALLNTAKLGYNKSILEIADIKSQALK